MWRGWLPIGPDALLRDAYGPIPEASAFQHGAGGSAIPEIVHGWQWSGTFGRWSALVTFVDGWRGFTHPLPLHRHTLLNDELPFESDNGSSPKPQRVRAGEDVLAVRRRAS
jgi:hypothetical protein